MIAGHVSVRQNKLKSPLKGSLFFPPVRKHGSRETAASGPSCVSNVVSGMCRNKEGGGHEKKNIYILSLI